MQEAVFKTNFYEHEVDSDGTKMTEYEDLGEKLKWEHDGNTSRDGVRNDNNDSGGSNT